MSHEVMMKINKIAEDKIRDYFGGTVTDQKKFSSIIEGMLPDVFDECLEDYLNEGPLIDEIFGEEILDCVQLPEDIYADGNTDDGEALASAGFGTDEDYGG